VCSYVAALRGSKIDGNLLECQPGENCYKDQAYKVLNFLKDKKVDIVHIHRRNFLTTEAFEFCKENRIPVLYTLHESAKDLLRKFDFSINFLNLDNLFFNAISYYQANELSKYFPIKKIIYNAIDTDLYQYSNNQRQNYFLAFGRIAREKGIHTAIQFAKKCNKQLIIGGNVQDRDYFKFEIEPYIDKVNIKFLGELTDQEKIPIYQNAAALLMLEEYDDPYPLVVLEALACGTPVIAFKKGGIPELVEHKRTGFLINNIKDGLKFVKELSRISNDDCRKSIEQKFSLNRMAQEYLSLYSDLVSEMKRGT